MDSAWTAVSAISSAVSALVIVAATLYAYLQFRESKRMRTAQIILQFQQWHATEPFKATRRRLLAGELDPHAVTSDDSAAVEELVDQMEFLGMLVDLDLLDYDVVAVFYRYSPTRVWLAAQPFIADMRKQAPGYGAYLEKLVKRYG